MMMNSDEQFNLDDETIRQLGLRLSHDTLVDQVAPDTRVFQYPVLDNVYIMESDLYGNRMPSGSCFLAFPGKHGFIGKHLSIEELKRSGVRDIEKLVQDNHEG
jgi:hypothetical protein